jgi:hypothetical protein
MGVQLSCAARKKKKERRSKVCQDLRGVCEGHSMRGWHQDGGGREKGEAPGHRLGGSHLVGGEGSRSRTRAEFLAAVGLTTTTTTTTHSYALTLVASPGGCVRTPGETREDSRVRSPHALLLPTGLLILDSRATRSLTCWAQGVWAWIPVSYRRTPARIHARFGRVGVGTRPCGIHAEP